ncbi:MAG: peptidylprolyl isomerase, partial [Prolixibacteraceae bacterium]|nr:peptidylprolyl isomerase [Prolixibacteraceae bacterium]
MKTILFFLGLNLIFLNSSAQKSIRCEIRTSLGDILIELYPEKAPQTVKNFLNYV